ncbi:peptide chain release factor 1, partial [Tremellales sp. Uapishka_1]
MTTAAVGQTYRGGSVGSGVRPRFDQPRIDTSRGYASKSKIQCTEVEGQQAKLIETAEIRVKAYKDAEGAESTVQEQIERARVMKELHPLSEAWDSYLNLRQAIIDVRPFLTDPDPSLREMFTAEHASLCDQLDQLLLSLLPKLLLPASPTTSLPMVMSLNAGVGGSEAALFVEELVRMYTRFAEKRNWKIETISAVEGPAGKGGGGLRESTMKFTGRDEEGEVYGLLQWERGVHRVQRVPVTETQGRVHTSTVAVVVLPIYPDTPDAPLVDPKDVKTEVMRSRGAGGQHVNKTESAVRLTHIPTGISVSMQDSRSQHQNKAWAWEVLRARLSERKHDAEVERRRASRRDQVKGADRSDKVRTYNFPQDRLSDHRIGLTLTGLQSIMDGDGLDMVIDELKNDLESRRMECLMQGEEDIDY